MDGLGCEFPRRHRNFQSCVAELNDSGGRSSRGRHFLPARIWDSNHTSFLVACACLSAATAVMNPIESALLRRNIYRDVAGVCLRSASYRLLGSPYTTGDYDTVARVGLTRRPSILLQFSIVSSQGAGGFVRRFFRQNIIAVRKTRLASWSSSSDQVVMALCCPSFRYRTADRIVRVTLILGPVADNDPMLAICS